MHIQLAFQPELMDVYHRSIMLGQLKDAKAKSLQ